MLGTTLMLMLNAYAYGSTATVYPDFLTDADKQRLVELRRAKMLFEGRHRQYFVIEGNTQHRFREEIVDGRVIQRYLTVNPVRLAAMKVADLICLKAPIIEAPEDFAAQDDAITRIERDSGFATVLYEAVMASAYAGEAWWQVFIRSDLGTPTGGAIIGNVPADQVFPDTGTLKPNGTYGRVVKQWIVDAPGSNGKVKLLRREIHESGAVYNQLFQLTERGGIQSALSLKALPDTAELLPEQATGASAPLLQLVPNFMLDGKCIGDLSECGTDSMLDQINAVATQIARIVAKHADPKMGMPEDMFDQDGNVKVADDVFAFKGEGEKPFYLVWDAQLEHAFKLLDWSLRTFLMLDEISPSLVGMKEGAAPDAWRKLRLEAATTLAKSARRILYLDRSVKDIWLAAGQAENALVPGVRYDVGDPDVTWRDGLPVDEDTQATALSTLRASGLISTARAVLKLVGDPEQAEVEVAEIEREAQAAMPPLFQGGGMAAAANG